MSNKFLFFLLIPFLFFVFGCDRVHNDSEGDEMARLDAWIGLNNLTEYKTPSGLYYISEREGNGISPEDSDIVLYSLVVRNLDGYIYSNTYKDTAILYDVFGLYKSTTHFAPDVNMFRSENSVPKGFAEGVGKMKEGGKARFIMPSILAWGKNGNNPIPPYTSLIYDIELIKVFKGDIEGFEKSIINEYLIKNTGFSYVSDSIYYKKISDNNPIEVSSHVNSRTHASFVYPVKGDTVSVNYIGRFLDGFIFDTNIKSVAVDSNIYNPNTLYTPFVFVVGAMNTILGYDLAVRQMTIGEKALFIIPSKYAYGTAGEKKGVTPIPSNTPLFFQIELKEINHKIAE